jgi:hypothetical protein
MLRIALAHATPRIAALRGLTGREEEACIAAAESGQPARDALTALIADCVEGFDHARATSLTVGDRDALALGIRAASFDAPMQARLSCPACGEPLDLSLDPLSLLAAEPPPEAAFHHDEFRFTCRAVTAADQQAVAHRPDPALALLERCVVAEDAAGRIDIATLPDALREQAAAHLLALDPQAETRLACACPACGSAVEGTLDAGGFLLAEVLRRAPALAREVLVLARATGWTEDAILAMPRRRRLRYAAMLGGEGAA